MSSIYTSFDCKKCENQLVLITEEVEKMDKNKYLACPYCGCRNIRKQKAADSLKECMSERTYKRNKGSLRQVRNE